MVTLREFLDREGSSPFAKWFGNLDATAAAKGTTALLRLELGNFSNVKGVGARAFLSTRSISVPATASISAKTATPFSSCSAAGPRSAKIATS